MHGCRLDEDREVKSPIAKFLTEEEMMHILKTMNAEAGDLLLLVADKDSVVFQSFRSKLRLEVAKKIWLN